MKTYIRAGLIVSFMIFVGTMAYLKVEHLPELASIVASPMGLYLGIKGVGTGTK